MSGAVCVAIAAAVGDLLLGWDNATIAGALIYIKREFNLQTAPAIEGLIVAMSLIGATLITTCSGPISDSIGRRPMLISSSVCYFVSSLMMLWSPNVYFLLLARLLEGFGVGLAVTLGPLYISETAPSEIRGLLNTLPQFAGSSGMFLSYCMVFGMSLMDAPNWRLMLGVLAIPSLIYFVLTVFYLPESPRWLVSKGRMVEAKKVLQRLRGREDVTGEMALLVEGLGTGSSETTIEEYLIGQDTSSLPKEIDPNSSMKDKIKLYGPNEGLSWIARPVGDGIASRRGSIRSIHPSMPLMDPLVTLFGSVHEQATDTGSMRSIIFPTFGSMFSVGGGKRARNEEWDDEENNYHHEDGGGDYGTDGGLENHDFDDNLHSPLMSRQATDNEMGPASQGSLWSVKPSGFMNGSTVESAAGMGIGGGWQLAWKWTEDEGLDGKKKSGFKRIYLHQDGASGSKRGSMVSMAGGDVGGGENEFKASALVSDSALCSKEMMEHYVGGPAMVHPSQASMKGPTWKDLMEPGVRHALVVGVGIQLLQQFSGINGVLYYTPQILEQAGVSVLLSNLGLSSSSASVLISGLTSLLMLPAIAIAMRLMDLSGRRTLLLTTIPILIISLVVLLMASVIHTSTIVHAALSTASVITYFCVFVAGFGPIPNILCAEIFPTRVRGRCITICALTFWICDIIVTYSLPVMLNNIGLAGVFGMYAAVCLVSFIFVFLKVPETKGMPLEVITEFFALGAMVQKE